MNKISPIVFVLLVTTLCVASENVTVIKDGVAKQAWMKNGSGSQQNGYVRAMGQGMVVSRVAMGNGDFAISCKLELEKIAGTAGSFFFNGNNFGFDSGGNPGKCFLDGPNIDTEGDDLSNVLIKANTPFTFEMKRQGDKLIFIIDGKVIATTKSTLSDDVIFAIRPCRGSIKIFDFKATGNVGMEVDENQFSTSSAIIQKFPVIYTPVNITEPLRIPLRKKTENKQLTLDFTVNNIKISQTFLLDVNADKGGQFVTLSAEQLQAIYNSGKSAFNVKTIYTQAKSENGERFSEYAFAAFMPQAKYGYPECKVQKVDGRVRVMVNGELLKDIIAYQQEEHGKFKGEQVVGFDGSNVKLYRYLLADHLYWNSADDPNLEGIYKAIESAMLRMITHSPDSRMIMTWYIYTPASFCEKYPDEALELDTKGKTLLNGPDKKLQPSYGSEKFRKVRKEIITYILNRVSKAPWAERLIGIQLAYGNAGEWNNWGYHESSFPDFSSQMQKRFSGWLKDKYHTVDALRKAWDNPQATFDNPVPSKKLRMGKPNTFFRDCPKDNQVVDYYTFWQTMTVETIEYFAKIIKEVSENKLLVGAYYGYYLGHLSGGVYHFQDSGHYGVGQYLRSPYLDFLCSPYPYASRLLNCPLNYIFSSITLHNKWMFIENDQRTQRSGKINIVYGTTSTIEESCEIAKRDFGLNITRGSSYCFMDFATGWYKDQEFLDTIKRLNTIAPVVLDQPLKKSEVAVLVGEQGIPYIAQQAGLALQPTFETLYRELDQTGAPYDLYYSEDIDKINFDGYKLVIFMNCLKFTAAQADIINKKIKTNNRSVVMLYGTGAIGDNGFDFNRMREITGIDITMLPNVNILSVSSNKITGRHNLRVYTPFAPVFEVTDKSAILLGKINDKFAGACEKKFANHRVFYVGYTGLCSEWLRYFFKRSGVHSYLKTPDTLYANGSFYCLYTRSAGQRELVFPEKCEVIYDLYDGVELGRNAHIVKVPCPAQPETRLIYAGKMTPAVKSFIESNVKKND